MKKINFDFSKLLTLTVFVLTLGRTFGEEITDKVPTDRDVTNSLRIWRHRRACLYSGQQLQLNNTRFGGKNFVQS